MFLKLKLRRFREDPFVQVRVKVVCINRLDGKIRMVEVMLHG